MLRKFLTLLLGLMAGLGLWAQDSNPILNQAAGNFKSPPPADTKKKNDLQDYRSKHEASGGARIQTNGFSIFGEYGWIKNMYRTRLIQFEYSYFIDYRQKSQQPQDQGGRNYEFGVQNRFHTLRFDYGFKRVLADKFDKNGVKLSFVYFGGLSMGLIKPYYLDLIYNIDGIPTIKAQRYSTSNAASFLNVDSINDAAPIRDGLGQMVPVGGLNSKMGLDFDWGKKDAFVKALQCGVMLDVYYERIPIMITTDNRFYQFTFYLSFQFGKRY